MIAWNLLVSFAIIYTGRFPRLGGKDILRPGNSGIFAPNVMSIQFKERQPALLERFGVVQLTAALHAGRINEAAALSKLDFTAR
jgi:hypothetical protein